MHLKIIDYSIIDNNIKRILKTNRLCLVLKNDAYGFGLVKILKLGLKNKIDLYAVNTIEEAILARRYCEKQIILFGNGTNQLKELKEYQVLPTAGSRREIELYSQNQIRFALEIDSGMNRFGIKSFEEEFLKNPYLDMVYTHFYKKLPANTVMMDRIEALCRKYGKTCHFGGSLVYGENSYCLRVGRLIYENSMQLYGRVVGIKNVLPGESVGYEGEYVAAKPQRIAILDVGYYNGIRIHFDGFVYCRGQRYRIVGRVCMNHAFVEADDKIEMNDLMEFFGNYIPLADFLEHNKMSEYESFLFLR